MIQCSRMKNRIFSLYYLLAAFSWAPPEVEVVLCGFADEICRVSMEIIEGEAPGAFEERVLQEVEKQRPDFSAKKTYFAEKIKEVPSKTSWINIVTDNEDTAFTEVMQKEPSSCYHDFMNRGEMLKINESINLAPGRYSLNKLYKLGGLKFRAGCFYSEIMHNLISVWLDYHEKNLDFVRKIRGIANDHKEREILNRLGMNNQPAETQFLLCMLRAARIDAYVYDNTKRCQITHFEFSQQMVDEARKHLTELGLLEESVEHFTS